MSIILFYIAISLGHILALTLAVNLVWSGDLPLEFSLENLPNLLKWSVLVLLTPAMIKPVGAMARQSGHRRAIVLIWVNYLPMPLGFAFGVLLAGME